MHGANAPCRTGDPHARGGRLSMNEETVSNIEVLGEVRKGPSSVLRVSVGEFRGQTYVYCQTWNKTEQDAGPGEETHLGLTWRPDTLRDLLPLFSKALETAAAEEREKRIRAADA